MGRAALLLASTFAIGLAQAQELLPNGGFEDHTACPDYISEIDRATGWSRPTNGTSDFLHSCSTDPFASVPSSQFGDEPAHGGEGYAGFYTFSHCDAAAGTTDGYREYVTHGLSAPLEIGRSYRVRFFLSLGEISMYAVHDIGAHFSVQPPHRDDDRVLRRTPQVVNSAWDWLDQRDGWMEVSGCFIADSAYAYLTIGCFTDSVSTAVHYAGPGPADQSFGYYFIDDISVMATDRPHLGPDTTVCAGITISVVDPVIGAVYVWNTGATGPSIAVDSAGLYSVSTSEPGCVLGDSMRVTIAAPFAIGLPVDTLVDLCATPLLRLALDSVPPDAHVVWSTGAEAPWIEVSAPGTYTVHLDGPGICASAASTTVIDGCAHPLFAPNAFTPNGDGINDVWRPLWQTNPDAALDLRIYDRWGRMLYQADGRSGWNGDGSGGPVPVGVYAYQLRALDSGAGVSRTVQGHVTVVR